MSLRLIYGRAGSGKTAACFKIIENLISDSSAEIIFLVPEQYSLLTEWRVLENGFAKRVDVLSFERLCHSVFSRVGPVYGEYASDSGKQMLMQRVLLMLKNKLTVLSAASETEGFSKVLTDTVSELKRHNISSQMLLDAVDTIDGPLKLKLADIALIYGEYDKQFAYPLCDEDDSLSVMLEKITSHNLYTNAHVIIDSFITFSPKQYSVIEEFMKRCESVTVALTTDLLIPTDNIADIFYASKKTSAKLFDLAATNNIPVKPNIFTGECKRYTNNSEFAHLEQNYFKYPAMAYSGQTDSISIFKANNYYGEIENTAVKIIRLCREENYRFRDITVVTRALETYAPLIRHIFGEYEILYHLDEKYNAMQHPFTHAALSIFIIVIHNFSFDALFTWLKSDYCGICEEDIYLLENFVLACGNTTKMWKSPDDWTFLPSGFNKESLFKINEIKNRVRTPLISFSEKFSGRKTVEEISSAFIDFLYMTGADKTVESNAKKYIEQGMVQKSIAETSVWNTLITTVDEMVSTLGDQYITFEKYLSVLTAGLKGCEIGQIPPTVDEVLVCPVDRFKSQNTKCIFMIGTTNGVFPASYNNEGILSDSDRNTLSVRGIELADDTAVKQAGENFVIYSALTSALDKLYIFYPIADSDGGALYPSNIIERLKSIFPDIKQEDNIFEKPDILPSVEGLVPSFNKMLLNREKYKEVYAWFAKNQPKKLNHALGALCYTNLPEKLSKEAVTLLYGNNPKGSVSRAEQYNRCQFSYFLKYGLNAKEREKYNIEPADAGIFMHEVLEEYSNFASGYGWDVITDELCRVKAGKITKTVLEKHLGDIYTSSPRFNFLLKKINKIMSTVAWSITEFYKKSSFVPLGYELTFDVNESFPPIEIDADGTKVILRGKVDRADIWRTENGNYVSIVDYKSSSKSINFSEILCGVQIQLPTYIKAVCEAIAQKEGVKTMPAAMLYYKIDSPVISADRNITDEEIIQKVQKSLRMQGLTLEGEKIADGINSVFAVKSPATAEQIEKVCKTAYKQLKNAFSGILKGNIGINPVRVSGFSACERCVYGSVCGFDTSLEGNKYRNIKKIDREEFFSLADKMD